MNAHTTNFARANVTNPANRADPTRVLRALRQYPHYVILDWDQDEDPGPLLELVADIAAIGSDTTQRDVSFTEIRVDAADAGREGVATFLSRTAQALAPHTDSSYLDRPQELMALQCVRAANSGGESVVTPVEDILNQLSEAHIDILRQPIFPFAEDALFPVIDGEIGEETIRYYRNQVDKACDLQNIRLTAAAVQALDALDQILADLAQAPQHRFLLRPGQVLLMHNNKALHARTGFTEISDRLLYRIRHYADALAPRPNSTPSTNHAPRITDLEEAAQQVLRNPTDPRALARHGDALLRAGRFDDAEQMFIACRILDPENHDALISLAGLASLNGDHDQARALTEQAIQAHPFFWANRFDPEKPSIIRSLGFDSASFQIIEYPDGSNAPAVKGGHFSLDHLLDERPYNFGILNLIDPDQDQFNLPPAELMINTISCPDRERDTLLTLARILDRHPQTRVINHPRRVLNTAREQIAQRLSAIPDVVCPRTERLHWRGGDPIHAAERELAGLGFDTPIILRSAGSQTGSDTVLARNGADIRGCFNAAPAGVDHYAIQYHDLSRGDGLYHKTRVFFIDGEFLPVANLYHDGWSVHSGDRYSVMTHNQWMQDEERAFLRDPVARLGDKAMVALHRIRDAVQLDYFGIDFTLLPDGSVFVFEANPAMRHNFDHADAFPYTRANLERISARFQRMVQDRTA